jgi:sialidase-1
LFSNPNTKEGRYNLTIKASFDNGKTWPRKYWLLLDEGYGRGYSCLTSIDEKNIGILYEGSQAEMTFQKVPFDYFLKK